MIDVLFIVQFPKTHYSHDLSHHFQLHIPHQYLQKLVLLNIGLKPTQIKDLPELIFMLITLTYQSNGPKH